MAMTRQRNGACTPTSAMSTGERSAYCACLTVRKCAGRVARSQRHYLLQGRRAEAERYLKRALEEARRGFGEGDGHVAAACNNLAELYRQNNDFEKAEPLYMEVSSSSPQGM